MSTGLVIGVRGIVGKELRSRTRGYWRPMLQLTIYLAIVTLAVVVVLGVSISSSGTLSPTLGESLFAALATGSTLLIAFVSPGLTAGAISGERERRTLDLLLVTRASPLGLIAGKLAGALLWVLYLLLASLPALGVVNLFGGVPPLQAAAALGVTVATAASYTALGLVLSAVLRRTVLATVVAYGAVLVTLTVIPIMGASLSLGSVFAPGGVTLPGLPSGQLGLPPASAWLTFISPVSAIISVLGGASGPLLGGTGGGASLLTTYIVRPTGPTTDVRTVTSLAPWVFYTFLSLTFGVLCVFIAAFALRPAWPRWGGRMRDA
jgi:ABC-type transport system involved in multi-copper enzyme maturation permease subunit